MKKSRNLWFLISKKYKNLKNHNFYDNVQQARSEGRGVLMRGFWGSKFLLFGKMFSILLGVFKKKIQPSPLNFSVFTKKILDTPLSQGMIGGFSPLSHLKILQFAKDFQKKNIKNLKIFLTLEKCLATQLVR